MLSITFVLSVTMILTSVKLLVSSVFWQVLSVQRLRNNCKVFR